jgi:hypothetical protein
VQKWAQFGDLEVMESESGGAGLPAELSELIGDPQAEHWARNCAWLPGTGHCRKRPCSTECPFRPLREAELRQVLRLRRRRRRAARQP